MWVSVARSPSRHPIAPPPVAVAAIASCARDLARSLHPHPHTAIEPHHRHSCGNRDTRTLVPYPRRLLCVFSSALVECVHISSASHSRALSPSACFATMLSSIVRRAVRAIGSRPVASVAASRTLSRQMSSTYCASRFVPASLRSFTATSR